MIGKVVVLIGVILLINVIGINCHGRLLVPPARSSAWREDPSRFPAFYTDNQMFCGGYDQQWNNNGGRCGICGEDYATYPKLFEKGGDYYRGYIVRSYTAGQTIEITVELTANHLGYFEFRLCNVDNSYGDATQECLDNTVLRDASGKTQIPIPGGLTGQTTYQLQLPSGFTCNHCVLQWKYNTGNSWGSDASGNGCMGCGAQEQFYGCSDISISGGGWQYKKSSDVQDEQDKRDKDETVPVSVNLLKRFLDELKRLKNMESEMKEKREQHDLNMRNELMQNREFEEKDLFSLYNKRGGVGSGLNLGGFNPFVRSNNENEETNNRAKYFSRSGVSFPISTHENGPENGEIDSYSRFNQKNKDSKGLNNRQLNQNSFNLRSLTEELISNLNLNQRSQADSEAFKRHDINFDLLNYNPYPISQNDKDPKFRSYQEQQRNVNDSEEKDISSLYIKRGAVGSGLNLGEFNQNNQLRSLDEHEETDKHGQYEKRVAKSFNLRQPNEQKRILEREELGALKQFKRNGIPIYQVRNDYLRYVKRSVNSADSSNNNAKLRSLIKKDSNSEQLRV